MRAWLLTIWNLPADQFANMLMLIGMGIVLIHVPLLVYVFIANRRERRIAHARRPPDLRLRQ